MFKTWLQKFAFYQKFASIVRILVVLIGIFFVFQIINFTYEKISKISLLDLISILGTDLTQDSYHRTNFLLLGSGGTEHVAGDLLDTIIVASYSHQFQTLTLLSIPRDFWLQVPGLPQMRINKIYQVEKERLQDSTAALNSTAWFVGELIDLPIHYFLKIDFPGLVQLIDKLGGVQILVTETIHDPQFPCADMLNFCTFHLDAGLQILDGATALKFARSRKTTSDFARSERQQQLLLAIQEQAQKKEILTSPGQLSEFFDLLKNYLETNLELREFITLGKLAANFQAQNLASLVLNNDPNTPGGLLFSPQREHFGGAAVLLPQTQDLTEIQTLTKILFGTPQALTAQLTIEVLNGSTQGGLARKVAYELNRYGLNTLQANNFPAGTTATTKIYFYTDDLVTKATAAAIKELIAGEVLPGPVDLKKRGYDLTVVLGQDYPEL